MTTPWLPHLKTVEADPRWRNNAACANTPTSTFFPEHDDRKAVAAAATICAQCPAILPCAAYASEHHPHGIWAGRLWTARNGKRLGGPTVRDGLATAR